MKRIAFIIAVVLLLGLTPMFVVAIVGQKHLEHPDYLYGDNEFEEMKNVALNYDRMKNTHMDSLFTITAQELLIEKIRTFERKRNWGLSWEKECDATYALRNLYKNLDILLAEDDNPTYEFCKVTYRSKFDDKKDKTIFLVYEYVGDYLVNMGFSEKELKKGDNDYSKFHPIHADKVFGVLLMSDLGWDKIYEPPRTSKAYANK